MDIFEVIQEASIVKLEAAVQLKVDDGYIPVGNPVHLGGAIIQNVFKGGSSSGASSLKHTYNAGENLGGQRVVMISNGDAVYYNPTLESSYQLTLGITNQASSLNTPVDVISDGIITSPGWGLTQDAIYYADANGVISLTPAAIPGIFQIVGIAISPDTLKICFSEPVVTI